MKVLHLPSITGGNAYGLVEAEKKLGLESRLLTFGSTKFNYPSDIIFLVENKSLIQQLFARLKAYYLFHKKFDVYHFNFGSSLLHAPQYGLNLFDLPFYSSSAKKFMTLQGCDARQKYPTMQRHQNLNSTNAACFEKNCYLGVCNSGKRDDWRKKTLEKADKYIDKFFYLNPDLLYFLPKEKSLFLPYTISHFHQIESKSETFFIDDKIKIAHAPSQREAKGTQYILEALSKLQEKYPGKIELILIENLSHSDAIKKYLEADLFIDQVLIGWYGAVSVEVMKMGIPVACYINHNDLNNIPVKLKNQLPFINIDKNNIFNILEEVIKHRERLPEQGKQCLDFVNKWHLPENVARITKAAYLNLDINYDHF